MCLLLTIKHHLRIIQKRGEKHTSWSEWEIHNKHTWKRSSPARSAKTQQAILILPLLVFSKQCSSLSLSLSYALSPGLLSLKLPRSLCNQLLKRYLSPFPYVFNSVTSLLKQPWLLCQNYPQKKISSGHLHKPKQPTLLHNSQNIPMAMCHTLVAYRKNHYSLPTYKMSLPDDQS